MISRSARSYLPKQSFLVIASNFYYMSNSNIKLLIGRKNMFLHEDIRSCKGRNLGIINTSGHVWNEQRRTSLIILRDLGLMQTSLSVPMVHEADLIIDKLLESENGVAVIDSTFNTAIINVLWQIVASKRFEMNHPETERMMHMINASFKVGFRKVQFLPNFLTKHLPLGEVDSYFFELKAAMKKLVKEHLETIDYDNPRDFIDVYLKKMLTNSSLDEEHLVVICLDFFHAGAETTSTTLSWVRNDQIKNMISFS